MANWYWTSTGFVCRGNFMHYLQTQSVEFYRRRTRESYPISFYIPISKFPKAFGIKRPLFLDFTIDFYSQVRTAKSNEMTARSHYISWQRDKGDSRRRSSIRFAHLLKQTISSLSTPYLYCTLAKQYHVMLSCENFVSD